MIKISQCKRAWEWFQRIKCHKFCDHSIMNWLWTYSKRSRVFAFLSMFGEGVGDRLHAAAKYAEWRVHFHWVKVTFLSLSNQYWSRFTEHKIWQLIITTRKDDNIVHTFRIENCLKCVSITFYFNPNLLHWHWSTLLRKMERIAKMHSVQ